MTHLFTPTQSPTPQSIINHTETFIPSKDSSLEASIATLQAKLIKLGFVVTEQSWLNDIEGIWSVHVTDTACKRLFSNGKGASELAARASALGEFFERLSTNYFWTHFYLGETIANAPWVHYPQEHWFNLTAKGTRHKKLTELPKGLLNPELHLFYNPNNAIEPQQLVDLNSGNSERGICTIPYTRLRDDTVVLVPVNLIGNLYVSNGMSAGNTLMEARVQAMAEIFERYIKFNIIKDSICLPNVPDNVINRYPKIAAGIAGLRAAGYGILVKDASLGGQYPVICVTMLNPKDQGVFASFGAHPRFEVALERSLTELLQGRAIDDLNDFPAPSFDADEIADAANLEIHFVDSSGVVGWDFLRDTADYPFVDWNFGTTTQEDYDWCINAIHTMKYDIYVADFTHLGVYSCRILVPGMSEIYPIDELQFQNNSVGNAVRAAILKLPTLTDDECAALLEQLLALDLPDSLQVTTLIGLAADAGTPWQWLRLGELKTLLALAAGDIDEAIEGCAWVIQMAQLTEPRTRVYKAIEAMLKLDNPAPFEENLRLLYGDSTIEQAAQLIHADTYPEARFFGLGLLGSNMEGSTMHTQLLAAYDKVRAVQGI
jgi:ribosomal protein S12 methylthiotransferase accessory factor